MHTDTRGLGSVDNTVPPFSGASYQERSAPLISIIVAVFNGGQTIQRCIDSVASQSYPNKELIVMDGGSTDGTVDVLKANSDAIAYWESKPDRGITHAWNKALQRCKGRWICFLGSDDVFVSELVLQNFSLHLMEHDDRYLVHGKVLLKGGPWDGLCVGEPWNWRKFRRRMSIPHPGAFHHGRLFDTVGQFDESFQIAADYELLLRLRDKLLPLFVDDQIVVMDAGGISMSNTKLALHETKAAQLKNNVAHSLVIAFWDFAYRTRERFLP